MKYYSPQFSVNTKSETCIWSCVPNRNNAGDWLVVGVALLAVIPISINVGFSGLESLVPKDYALLPDDTASVILDHKLVLPIEHILFLVFKEEEFTLVGVTDPDQLKDVWILLFIEGMKQDVWDSGHPLGSVLLLH